MKSYYLFEAPNGDAVVAMTRKSPEERIADSVKNRSHESRFCSFVKQYPFFTVRQIDRPISLTLRHNLIQHILK